MCTVSRNVHCLLSNIEVPATDYDPPPSLRAHIGDWSHDYLMQTSLGAPACSTTTNLDFMLEAWCLD